MMGTNLIWWLSLSSNNERATTAIKDTAAMMRSWTRNVPKELVPILSFSVIKLKKSTPKMSEKLLSYTTNSRNRGGRPFTVGIAMALLITQRGIAFARLSLKVLLPKYWNKPARINARAKIGRVPPRSDLMIRGFVELFNSSSRAPSRTIRIKPIVPRIGKIGPKLGSKISNRSETILKNSTE